MTSEVERFTKLMMLTTSSNDNEALVALRKANAMLAEHNNNWEDFIKGKVRMSADERPPSGGASSQRPSGSNDKHTDSTEIEPMFQYLFNNLHPDNTFLEFVESVYEWWSEKGFLTNKQYRAIKNAYDMRRT